MKRMIIALSVVFGTTVLATCGNSGTRDASAKKSNSDISKIMGAVKYTCEMHTDVMSDTPGHCPKCGMALVRFADSSKKKMDRDTMNIKP
jgi:membrane-associated PAP2 superfamily phosphatase